MRLSGSTGRIGVGFILTIGVAVALPYTAFGAAHSVGGAGRFGAHGTRGGHSFPHRFHGFGVLGVDGVSEPQVIIIQQYQSPIASEQREPAKYGIYVPPRWVDGGHGVQLLMPGYWTSPKQAAER